MKRKLFIATLVSIFIVCLFCGLTACKEEHTHTYDQKITTENFIATNATCTTKAKYYYSCECGAKDSLTFEYGEVLEHSFTDYVSDNNATCTENGTETATCDRVGCNEKHTRTQSNTALNHNYGAPVYTWNDDKCTATRICTNDSTHQETETVTAVYMKDTDATCLSAETGHYKATFSNSAFVMQETEENSLIKGEALDHSFDQPTYTWNNDKCTATRICSRDNSHVETETVTATYVKDTNVTCTAPEKGHYKATFVNSAFGEKETAVNSEIVGEPLDHAYETPTYNWSDDKCTATRICSNNNSHKEIETVVALYEKDTDATCTTPEKGHYIATFDNNAFATQQTTENSFVNGKELGHNWDDGETIKGATCTELGTTLFSCGRCNETKTEDIAKKSHETASKVIDPTCDAPGYTLTYCKNCSYSDWSNFKKSKEHSGSGSCSYCGKSYFSIVGNYIRENGVSGSANGRSYYNIPYQDGNIIYALYYYPSSQSLECVVYYQGSSSDTVFNLIMDTTTGVYDWEIVLSSGSYMLGYLTASNFTSSTSYIPYTDVYPNSSSVANAANEAAIVYLKEALRYFNVILKLCPENVTIRDFGFTSYYGVTVHEHTWAQVGTYTKSTCTTSGNVKYKCASCDVTKTEIISAHGHIYAPQVKTQEETCVQVGIIEEKCYFCSYVKKTEIDKLDHDYSDVVTAPTCLEDGYTTHTCPDCGDVLVDTYIDALGHKTTEHFTLKHQSCTETGIERYTCINGDCGYYVDEIIPMDDHDYEEIVGAAGYITEKCSVCSKTVATPISYTIGYNLDGGTATNNPTYTIETDTFTLVNPTRKGYEFTGWTGTSLSSKTMTVTISKGSLGERSYTANWTANTYTLTYNVNGGDTLANTKQSVTYDVDYSTITPTRTGYSFVKWATSDGDVYSGGKWQTDSDVIVIAEWKANTDTKYIVRHHQQNINDDDYTVFETDNLKGESDSSITPSVNTYTGFTSPKSTTTTILPDGNRVVDYYYTRNYYTISFVTNGGNDIETIEQKYQSTLNIPNGVRDGFTFGGWFTDVQLSSSYSDTTMPATNKIVYAWWSEENKPTDFTYIGTDSITINSYKGTNGIIRIPSYIGNVAVNSIVDSAFENNSVIQQITFSENIISIGNYALKNCINLEKIIVINSNENYCSINGDLYNVDGTTLIQYAVGKSDNSFETSNTVSSINAYAFYGSENLKEVVITNNQTILMKNSFTGCYGLENLTLSLYDSNTYLGYIFGADSYSYNSSYVPQSLQKVTVKGTESIHETAFYGCNYIESITILDTTTAIKENTFSNLIGLKELVISDSVTKIGGTKNFSQGILNGCTSLESITIPFVGSSKTATGYQSVFGYLFGYTGEKSSSAISGTTYQIEDGRSTGSNTYKYVHYYIPTSLKSVTVTGGEIPAYAFRNCTMLTSITLPESATTIGSYAFANCDGLTEIEISETVTTIGERAFNDCDNLQNIVIPDNVTSLGTYVFNSCDKLSEVTFGAGLTEIPSNTFYQCALLENVEIPSNITKIGGWAFYQCTALTEIIIPDNVTTIEYYAFSGCTSVTSITIGAGITSLGSSAFYNNTALIEIKYNAMTCADLSSTNDAFRNAGAEGIGTSVTIGANVTRIPKYLFCPDYSKEYYIPKITSLVFEEGSQCKTISENAFRGLSGLKELAIPDSVTSIGENAVKGCSSLEYITLPFVGNSKNASSEKAVLGYIFGHKLSKYANENGMICQYTLNTTSEYKYYHYYIPTSLKSVTITGGEIPAYAFRNCTMLTSITLPETATTIGAYAFSNCDGLTGIEIPETVTAIGEYAFANCDGILEMAIPNNVKLVGNGLFYNCSKIEEIAIGSGITELSQDIFNGCASLNNFVIPNNITTIGSYAFRYCSSLTDIIIPNGVTTIGTWCFSNCTTLQSITIGEGLTSIGLAFDYCYALKELHYNAINCEDRNSSSGAFLGAGRDSSGLTITIGANVEKIPAYIFCPDAADESYLTNVKNIIFEENSKCQSIGNSAFRGLSGLKELVIPDSVTSIGENAVKGCSSLEYITLPFVGNSKNASSEKAVLGYIFGHKLSKYANENGMICQYTLNTTSEYKYYHYYIPTSLKSVTITGGEIPAYAFRNCTMLTSITLPETATTIGAYAFSNCDGLTTLEIPKTVTTIGDYAFSGSDKLGGVILPASVIEIKACAFYNCEGLLIIDIPDTVTLIGSQAFYSCDNLESAHIGSGVTTIPSMLFYNCINLQNISLPKGLTSIANNAFDYTGYYNDSMNWENKVLYIGQYLIKANTTISGQCIVKEGTACIAESAFYKCSSLESIVVPLSVKIVNYNAFASCSLKTVYYGGKSTDWTKITFGEYNTSLKNATRYYYSETEPALNVDGTDYNGKNWHYVDNIVTPWIYTKEE